MVVDVLTVENGRIVESNAFVGAHHVAAFDMPAMLEHQTS
jgi:RNA polymerase sigma-70 factor (ECF subfamily)